MGHGAPPRTIPELQLTLMKPGPPLDEESAEAFRRMLAKGTLGAVGLSTDDCHTTYKELSCQGRRVHPGAR